MRDTTSTTIKLCRFEGHQVRMMDQSGELWWVAKDVCDVLGTDTSNLSKVIDEDERGTYIIRTLGGMQEVATVNEPGLYSLILKSRKPEAKAFKRWITHEVLPSLRKTGSYSVQGHAVPRTYLEALRAHLESEEARQKAEAQAAALLPDAMHARRIADSDTLVTSTVIAKQLGTDAVKLNAFLRSKQVIFRSGKTWLPYKRHEDSGICRVITHHYTRSDGTEGTKDLLKWTERGRRLIHDLWTEAHAVTAEVAS